MFERIAAVDTLRDGFRRVQANQGGPGGDGLTIGAYEIGLDGRLQRLSRLLTSGDYWPGPVRMAHIPKPGGTTRTLRIPCIADRIVQAATLIVLGPVLDTEFSDASYAYRPGRGVRDAIRRVAALRREGFIWTVETDVDDFFDTIPHTKLITRVERSVSCERTRDLIERWLAAYGPEGRGVPQGGPISPLLANLYLDDLDDAIQSEGVRLIRYADDLVLLTRTREKADIALTKLEGLLAAQGLRANPEATRIRSFDETLDFLGVRFVRTLAFDAIDDEEDLAGTPQVVVGRSVAEPLPPGPPDLLDTSALGARQSGLRVLYVRERGRRLGLYGEAFAVREGSDIVLAVAPPRVDRIEVGPEAFIDGEALRHAGRMGITVALTDGYGDTLSEMQIMAHGRATLHLAQARTVLSEDLRVDLARRLVEGRIRGQWELLKRLNRLRKAPDIDLVAHKLKGMIRGLLRYKSVPELMGAEGQAAALYWPAYGLCLAKGWRFDRRIRRPAPDPVNAMLSLFASLLARDVGVVLERRGLHPGFGVLHEAGDDRDAVTFDLIEEFRAPLVEAPVITMVNNRVVNAQMFTTSPEGQCTIWAPTVQTLIRQYEAWINKAVISPLDGNKKAWRAVIGDQASLMAAHMLGERPYVPYRIRY